MSMSAFYMLYKEDPKKFCHHECIIRGCFPDLLMSDEPPTKLNSLFSFPFDIQSHFSWLCIELGQLKLLSEMQQTYQAAPD